MPSQVILKLSCLAFLALAVAGCPRRAENHIARSEPAHYPWQMPEYRHQGQVADPAGEKPNSSTADEAGTLGDAVQIPNDKGRHPALDTRDSFDPALLPGDWFIVCHVVEEKVILRTADDWSIVKFYDNGTLVLQPVIDGEQREANNGTWEKSGPGIMLMALGSNAPQTFYCQFSGRDFFYMWTFEQANGLWLVRQPDIASDRILVNDFELASGEKLHIGSVKDTSVDGTLSGPREYELHGSYAHGVLNVRWIDATNNIDGYAAFRVSPDWLSLDGVWWLNDYEAAPFGGRWQTAPAAETSAGGQP